MSKNLEKFQSLFKLVKNIIYEFKQTLLSITTN